MRVGLLPCHNEFANLLNLALYNLVGLDKVEYILARVQHGGVVASADSRTNCRQRQFGVLLGQIHRNLSSLCNLASTLR